MALPGTDTEVRERVKTALNISGLPDKLTLADALVDEIVEDAVQRYSADEPQRKVHPITGDASTKRWVLTAEISDWSEGFSSIGEIRIHHETDADVRGRHLRPEEFATYREDVSGATKDILLLAWAPDTTTRASIHYSALQVLDNSSTTIQASHRLAVVNLASSIASRWIAQRASDQRDTAISADAVDYGALSEKFNARADEWEGAYKAVVLGEDRNIIAATAVRLEPSPEDRARYSTHFGYRIPERPR